MLTAASFMFDLSVLQVARSRFTTVNAFKSSSQNVLEVLELKAFFADVQSCVAL